MACAALAAGNAGSAAAETILSPPGEALAYGANPSRTGESSEIAPFGPLDVDWSVELGIGVQQPLIVGDTVLVASGFENSAGGDPGKITALDAADGSVRWQQTTAPLGAAPIAAGEGVVVSIASNGLLAGFAVGTGEPLWSRMVPLGRPVAPVVDGGVAYVWGSVDSFDRGRFYAYRVSDGAPVWPEDGLLTPQAEVELRPRALAGPALDGSRLYVASPSGGAAAVDRSDGELAWFQPERDDDGYGLARALVAGDAVFGGPRRSYAAADGTPRADTQVPLVAAAGALGYGVSDDAIVATPLDGSGGGWRRDLDPVLDLSSPVIVGPTTFTSAGNDLYGLGTTGGKLLSLHEDLGEGVGTGNFDDETYSGISAGAGRLFIGGGSRVVALRSILEPGPAGVDMAASGFDVDIGTKVLFVGGIGRELLGQVPALDLRLDPAPFGKFKTVSSQPLEEDGTAYTRRGIGSNTRVSFQLPDGSAADTLLIRAYPDYKVRVRAVSRKRGQVKGQVLGIPPAKIRRLKMFAYFGDESRRRFKRLGAGRVRPAGKRKAQAKIRFKLLKPKQVGKGDVVAICVRKLGRRWGRNVGLQKRCGRKRVRYAKNDRPLPTARAGRPSSELRTTAGGNAATVSPSAAAAGAAQP